MSCVQAFHQFLLLFKAMEKRTGAYPSIRQKLLQFQDYVLGFHVPSPIQKKQNLLITFSGKCVIKMVNVILIVVFSRGQ